jgi:hypothetical protein
MPIVPIIAAPKVDIAHDSIHKGAFFSTHNISTGLTVANPKQFLYIASQSCPIPANTTQTHFRFIVSCDLGVKVEFFEAPEISSNGTPIDIINQDRNSSQPDDDSMFEDTVVTSDGTKLYEELIGSASSGGTGGLLIRDEDEIILKIGTAYLLRITPLVDNVNITTHTRHYDARPNIP